jgi:hypothetical protein
VGEGGGEVDEFVDVEGFWSDLGFEIEGIEEMVDCGFIECLAPGG